MPTVLTVKPLDPPTGSLARNTTAGWSLISSDIVTLLLTVFPGDSVWWGLGLLAVGLFILINK